MNNELERMWKETVADTIPGFAWETKEKSESPD
jgi:hypothetical protein